jgi:hypothetical protein
MDVERSCSFACEPIEGFIRLRKSRGQKTLMAHVCQLRELGTGTHCLGIERPGQRHH